MEAWECPGSQREAAEFHQALGIVTCNGASLVFHSINCWRLWQLLADVSNPYLESDMGMAFYEGEADGHWSAEDWAGCGRGDAETTYYEIYPKRSRLADTATSTTTTTTMTARDDRRLATATITAEVVLLTLKDPHGVPTATITRIRDLMTSKMAADVVAGHDEKQPRTTHRYRHGPNHHRDWSRWGSIGN